MAGLIFQEHIELTHPQVRRLESVIFCSLLSAGVCLTSAIAGRDVLPVKLRSLFLGTAELSLVATSAAYELWRKANERYQPYREAQERQLKLGNAAQTFESELIAEAESKIRAIDSIRHMNAPAEFKIAYLKEKGLLDLLTGGKEVLEHKRQQSANVVTTTATEAQAVAAAPTQFSGSGTVQVFDDRATRNIHSQPVAVPSVLETVDIAEVIGNYDGHVLLACRTGSGKTSTLQAAIAKKHQRYGGMVDFHIIDPKGAYWLGLENDKDYAFVPTDNTLQLAVNRAEVVCKVLAARMQQRMQQGGHWDMPPMPVILIVDELNTLLVRLEAYNKGLAKTFMQNLIQIICQGREDNVHLWAVAQTSQVEQLQASGVKLNTSMQQNMLCVALARLGDYQSVSGAIKNRYVVPAEEDRDRLNTELQQYKASSPNTQAPIAFISSQGGQLGQVPDYSAYKTMTLPRKAQNQSTDEILSESEADTTWIVDAVGQWLQEQGLSCTIQTIQTAYRAIAGQSIDEQGAELIRRELL